MPGSAKIEILEKKIKVVTNFLIIRGFNSSYYCLIRNEFDTLRFRPSTCLQIRELDFFIFYFLNQNSCCRYSKNNINEWFFGESKTHDCLN